MQTGRSSSPENKGGIATSFGRMSISKDNRENVQTSVTRSRAWFLNAGRRILDSIIRLLNWAYGISRVLLKIAKL